MKNKYLLARIIKVTVLSLVVVFVSTKLSAQTLQIQAITETIDYQNAPNGPSSVSVLENDLLNNVTPTANEVIISAVNIPIGFTLNADGTFNIALGTQAGSYTFTYQICETANPNNCAVATSIFNLTSNIQAISETIDYQNAPNASSSVSVLANDLLNNVTPTANDVMISTVSIPAGFTLNADGTFNIALGTQAGSYTFTYQICETANPNNCAVATSIFNLTSNIQAISETIDYQNAPNAPASVSVLANDLLNNITATANDVIISTVSIPAGFTLNADGTFNIALGTQAGSYTFTYQICETANPNNCAVATSIFNLTSNIVAFNDAFYFETPPDTGSVVSVLDNDILNNLTPNQSNVNISFVNMPAGFALNDDGTIIIPSSFTEGNFSIDYRICETAFADNCVIANASIVIAAPFAPNGNIFQTVPTNGTLTDLQVSGQNILWYSTPNLTSSPIPPTTIVSIGSTYYATQTVNNIESIDRLSVTVSSALSINSFSLDKIKVYPNPVADNLFITNEKNIEGVEIFSLLGQKVISKKVDELQSVINLSELQQGAYIIKIYCEGQSKTFRVIKK
jgi:cell division protein FtsL